MSGKKMIFKFSKIKFRYNSGPISPTKNPSCENWTRYFFTSCNRYTLWKLDVYAKWNDLVKYASQFDIIYGTWNPPL